MGRNITQTSPVCEFSPIEWIRPHTDSIATGPVNSPHGNCGPLDHQVIEGTFCSDAQYVNTISV